LVDLSPALKPLSGFFGLQCLQQLPCVQLSRMIIWYTPAL
jgi:hypothetical protein